MRLPCGGTEAHGPSGTLVAGDTGLVRTHAFRPAQEAVNLVPSRFVELAETERQIDHAAQVGKKIGCNVSMLQNVIENDPWTLRCNGATKVQKPFRVFSHILPVLPEVEFDHDAAGEYRSSVHLLLRLKIEKDKEIRR